MLHCMVFTEAHFQFHIHPTYINAKVNHVADDLSCNNLSSFLSKVPRANPYPVPVPLPLLNLLLNPLADWTSPAWCRQFNDIA